MSCGNPSCTGHHLYDPQQEAEDFLLYHEWLEKKNVADSNKIRFRYILSQKLCIDRRDPQDYPGLYHAAKLVECCDLKKLKPHQHASLRKCMTHVYKTHQNRGLFLVGDVFGKDKDWKIVRQMSDAEGYYNCGVYIVEDTTQEDEEPGVLKVLPCSPKHPKFALREINILWKLEGQDNIIDICDSFLPEDPKIAPWLITDFCNGGTLQKPALEMSQRKIRVPELFIWHVFESILVALHYCHTGPTYPKSGTWDPIYHCDVIQGNIFLDFSDAPGYPCPDVKLGDFGCAVTQSELDERPKLIESGQKAEKLSYICPAAVTPEGQHVGTSSADIWQLGLAVLRLLAVTRLGYNRADPDEPELELVLKHIDKHHAGRMWDLRQLLMMCLAEDPSRRPTAEQLLGELHKRRSDLMISGKLN